jgi:hypothetical protein
MPNSARTTDITSLTWNLFLAPTIPAITTDVAPGETERLWPPISSTLISGARDAVLVDTPITVEPARALVNWPVAGGKWARAPVLSRWSIKFSSSDRARFV